MDDFSLWENRQVEERKQRRKQPHGGEAGAAIEVEVWELPAAALGGFVDAIPAPVGIGTVELEDGEQVRGFVGEQYATQGAREITRLGSGRAYARERAAQAAG